MGVDNGAQHSLEVKAQQNILFDPLYANALCEKRENIEGKCNFNE